MDNVHLLMSIYISLKYTKVINNIIGMKEEYKTLLGDVFLVALEYPRSLCAEKQLVSNRM